MGFFPPKSRFGAKKRGRLVRGRIQSGGRGGVTPPQGLGIGFDCMIEFGKKDCGLDLIG